MTYLYHGSTTQNLKILEPRKRHTPYGEMNASIYATPSPAFAAAHSFPWTTDEGVELNVHGDHIVLTLPIGMKVRLQVPVSIYKVEDMGFVPTVKEITGYTWNTEQPVEIIEEIKYLSVEEAIVRSGGEVKYI